MRRLFNSNTSTLLAASLLLLAAVSPSSAQSGATKAAAGAAADASSSTATSAKAPALVSQKFESGGVVVDFSVQSIPNAAGRNDGLIAGADALTTLSVRDGRTGQPLTGLHPNVWIDARKSAQAPNEVACKDKIRLFMGGLLSTRADIDLNTYLMLTLNHDHTITFINPQVSFSVTKLEGIVELPGAGADWTLSRDKEFVYVTLPEQAAVGVVNTITRKLVGTISTGEGTRPTRLALQPDGRYVWVGLDGSPAVAVLDTSTRKLAASVPVGEGLHAVAFTPDSRFAYVSNSTSNTVSVVDAKRLAKVSDIKVGRTPAPIAYSSASRLVYVATINGATIEAIDPKTQSVVASIPTKRGAVALRFEPNGRFGLVVNQVESTVSVLDAATNTMTGTAEVSKSPDQVTFTPRYAYVRALDSEKTTLLDLSEVAKGKISPLSVTTGRLPASAAAQEIGVSDMIAPTPEGNAVMIASTPDQMIYYYVEGMMAPMGTFSNYKRRPHALMLIDRSMSEVAPGVYSTPVRLTRAGVFDVPVLIDQPRIVNCFQLEVAPSPDGEKQTSATTLSVEALFKGQQLKAGEAVSLRYKLTDTSTRQPVSGLGDVQVLVFEPPGIWQQRQYAAEVDKGVYEIKQTFPHQGVFNVMLRVTSRGVSFADLPFTPVTVTGDAPPANK